MQLAGARSDEVVGRAASRRGEAAHDAGHLHALVAHEHGARRHAVHGGLEIETEKVKIETEKPSARARRQLIEAFLLESP